MFLVADVDHIKLTFVIFEPSEIHAKMSNCSMHLCFFCCFFLCVCVFLKTFEKSESMTFLSVITINSVVIAESLRSFDVIPKEHIVLMLLLCVV